jgi:hypothetical protein
MQITSTGSNSWFEQVGLFATPPTYCSLAVGSLNGAAGGTTAYNCHLRFIPGAASPNWDIVSYSGQASGGGGGGPEPVGAWTIEGNPTSSTTTPTAFTIGSLTAKTTPASTDQLLLQDNAASGALKSVPWASLPSGGGGGMSIGGAITGGTAGEVLMVGAGSVLAQTTNLPVSVLNSGTSATSASFWRGDGTWANTLVPVLWTPASMGSALRAWYEMDKLTGSAGSSQPAIGDQSGNSYNLSQATVGMQGTLAVADQNGLNTLRFTRANSTQYQLALAILSGSTAGSLYIVFKPVSTATNNAMMDWGAPAPGTGNNDWPWSDGSFYSNFGATGNYTVGVPTGPLISTKYTIVSIYSDVNDWSFYVDGGTGGSAGGTSPLLHRAVNTVGWNAAAPYLGTDTVYFFDGWIAEVYFTNAHQSTADRQRNEGYLAWKWGLQGNLDPSHPYKSSAPTVGGTLMTIGAPVGSGSPGSVLYVGGGAVLGQDNANFFWDDGNKHLKVGNSGLVGALYVGGVPAIYEIIGTTNANWFEGNGGPGPGSSMSGAGGNYGTGDNALGAVTSGEFNFAIGTGALQACTTGYRNTAVGYLALSSITTGTYNFGLGYRAGAAISTGQGNTTMGGLGSLTSGDNNVAMGISSISQMTSGNSNTAIGGNAGNVFNAGSYNIFIGGSSATHWISGGNNTLVGNFSGYNITGGDSNTIIGPWGGPATSGALSNVIVLVDGVDATAAAYNAVTGLDYNFTTPHVWSFQYRTLNPVGLHVYNTTNADGGPLNNYERAILDWNVTSNIFRIGSQAGGTGTVRLIAIDGFQKPAAPAATDLPSGTCALINDTSGGQTWLCYNAAGTIRKVQLT